MISFVCPPPPLLPLKRRQVFLCILSSSLQFSGPIFANFIFLISEETKRYLYPNSEKDIHIPLHVSGMASLPSLEGRLRQ